jgi:hypothetical protein
MHDDNANINRAIRKLNRDLRARNANMTKAIEFQVKKNRSAATMRKVNAAKPGANAKRRKTHNAAAGMVALQNLFRRG